MPFALNMFKNKKIKTVFIFERAPLNLERAIKSREREREKEGKRFWGGGGADLLADQKQIQEVGSSENFKYLGSLRQPTALSGPGHLAMKSW